MVGGTGEVFFDDLRLYPPRCVPELGPAYDFTGDCIVNIADVGAIGEKWLRTDAQLSVQAPGDGPEGHWELDGSASDSSGGASSSHPRSSSRSASDSSAVLARRDGDRRISIL